MATPARHTGPPGSERQAGQPRSPVLVPFLSYVTLQFYLYYWVWQVADELDRFDPYRRSPRSTASWAVPLAVTGQVVVGTAVVAVLLLEAVAPASLDPASLSPGLIAAVLVVVLGALAYLVGSILLWVALWRTWTVTEAHEAAVSAEALSPGLLLALWIASALVFAAIPIVGWAIQLGVRSWVLYRTQRGLNRVWAAARDGYEPRRPQPGAGSPDAPGAPSGPARPPTRDRSPPSANPGPETVGFQCRACGNREQIPPRRPLKVTCPSCGEVEILE